MTRNPLRPGLPFSLDQHVSPGRRVSPYVSPEGTMDNANMTDSERPAEHQPPIRWGYGFNGLQKRNESALAGLRS